MRRIDPSRHWVPGALLAVTALALVGAGTAKKKRSEGPPPKVGETIADIANVVMTGETRLEGVGLVVGLDNTGAEPPPSYFREKLINDMRKAGVENPNRLLADPRLSMVIVRARIPNGVTTHDRIDAEVEVPPACGTKSFAGGYLLQTRLREILIAGGMPKEGPDAAIAEGAIMIGTEAKPKDPKVGRALGATRVKKDIPFNLLIKEQRRSFRTANMVEKVINQRFTQRDGVDRKGVATAKTDQYLVLKVPRVYHNNPGRYFKVIKTLPMVNNPALREQRLAAWGQDLLDPKKAGLAALRLEGLGVTAIEPLKAALANSNEQVRFFAAEALAYLDDASGAEVLAATVVRRPDFRTYALAAMASMDQPASHMRLRKLMDEPDVAVRYGAFNALRTLDASDAFLGRVRVLDDPEEHSHDGSDSLALAIADHSRKTHPQDPFALYIVDCEGPPLIHVASNRRTEIVVFGRDQKLLTPVVLGRGAILLNASDGDDALQISKISTNQFGDADEKVVSSLEVGDVIRRMANLGANYPDVVEIIEGASRQKNLPGPLVMDAVPAASLVYTQAQLAGLDATAKKDDAVKQTKLEQSQKPAGLLGRLRRLFDR